MSKKLRNILQYVVFLGGGLALVWWQLSKMTPEQFAQFKQAITDVRYRFVPLIIIMSLLSHLARALRWRLLMEPLGYHPSVANTFSTTMVGYLANSAVPRLGEIAKCSLLAKHENLKTDKLIGTIVIERAFDLFCYLIFIVITILIQVNTIGNYAMEQFSKIGATSKIPIWAKAIGFVVILFAIIYLVRWLYNKYPNNKIVQKVSGFLGGLKEGITSVKKLRKRKQFVFYTILIWAMYLLQIYVGFWAMDATDNLSIKAAFSVLTLATVAMIATPGGIGLFPICVMQTLVVYGIEESLGEAFGWVMWGVSTAIILVVGLICYLILPIINKKRQEIN